MTINWKKEKYLCEKWGVAWDKNSPELVGETLESLTNKYKKDPVLNNVPLNRWDTLAISFLAYNRMANLSLAEAVAMQKCAAIELIEKHIGG